MQKNGGAPSVLDPAVEQPLVVDIDRHVQETWSIFAQYADPAFRDRVYARVPLPDGRTGLAIDGRPMPGWSAAMWDDPNANDFFHDGRFAPNNPTIGAHDPASFLAAMDAEGVDIAILAPTLAMGNASVPDGQLGSALCRAYARWVDEFRQADPTRLVPLYPVNLYDVEQAVADCRWAVKEMGFPSIMVMAFPVGERGLHHPDFRPFWAEAQDLDVPVQIHSASSLPDLDGRGALVDLVAGAKRLGGNLFLHHLVSHRLESEHAMLAVVAGGILERYPRLRVAFSESGGGWVASWLEAMDGHFHSVMRRWVPWLQMEPSEYFRRQCLAGFEAEEEAIAADAVRIGVDNVAWFSDYPHWDCVFPGAVEAVRETTAALSPDGQAKVLGGNAARFFGLETPVPAARRLETAAAAMAG